MGKKKPTIKLSGKPKQRTVKVNIAAKSLGKLKKKQLTVKLKGVKKKVAFRINKKGRLVVRVPKGIKPGNRVLVVTLKATPTSKRVKQRITLKIRR